MSNRFSGMCGMSIEMLPIYQNLIVQIHEKNFNLNVLPNSKSQFKDEKPTLRLNDL